MEESLNVLVIILSSFLGLFLLLSIVLLVKLIQITNQVKRVTDRVDAAVNKASEAIDVLHKAAGPVAIGKIIAALVDHFGGSKSGKKKSDTK
jgi:hypothetical protein